MKGNNKIKTVGGYRFLFVKKGVDYYSDSSIEVYDSFSKNAEPIFSFRFTSMLSLDEFEKLALKYEHRAFAKRLFEKLSQISFALLEMSIQWLNEIRRTNGLFDIEKIRNDYMNFGMLTLDCPLCKAASQIKIKSINIYGCLDLALNISKQNNITIVEELLYSNYTSKPKSLTKFVYTEIGQSLVDTVIFITYSKFGNHLKEFSTKLNKPETLLGLFNSNKERAEEFRRYLLELGLNPSSSDREITALIDAAIDTGILSSTYSRKNIFQVIVKEIGIAKMHGAKPRKEGNKYDHLYKAACRYLNS
jgi:hypothetical protein